ncbi:Vacuolar cation-chloride cotransporter 1 [Komagataella phaffii CBS 7435]|uniref:Vacuolar cation-chloride cotransporter 1 n=2 Tax=Komagataella phaffii TaxID=460519 RepID=F2QVT8_KOMPC|nr:Putative ion transporter, similar to mammalian electroneutral Na(+)-(K+)-C1-cotransporter family [Komagataella phaffii GS115]AOA64271.1 GQ67_03728T0 [Komagataella phaffii]CAH2449534.1 Vacuolar cation-chloride cotransporter 1 [Komagataella phaffii CBS 7435]AOA68776.1 GQ68_03700T0 [Komagataella phaffii GS115]CAY70692.1 Putative ion transporter, similar to mammalian electroneutral Na(+)-(K+)-C1-cotransporter family [Komagataella phaffii GS115]CCA39516.1 Vacuolar cation-chloride cotransporter 1
MSPERTPLLPLTKPKPHQETASVSSKAEDHKLTTFGGVFIPTTLNVLSILMFLRFGFILGQMGILGCLLLLVMSYTIDLLTTVSISAIATNGTVRGGGAYYMISRSLGVEFGGAIGFIFFIGQVLNSSLNVAGFIEPLMVNFNTESGLLGSFLPPGKWFEFAYCSLFLLICTCVALIGSSSVSKAGTFLCFALLIATISVPVSTLFVQPFEVPSMNSFYSGPSLTTAKANMFPHFTKGAAGSQIKGRETFNDLFGIFFPATAGIFAGASMSGDLKRPSYSIPRGTLWGLAITFVCYASVIIAMGVSIPRDLLHKDIQVIQTVSMSKPLIILGELSTSLFSVIVGIVGAAKVLQAIARDKIFPGISLFAKGHKKTDDPTIGILFTWVLTQLFLFADINRIATFITMAFLMTFIVTNIACLLLKIGSAPNFRPSFKYFNTATAFFGAVACFLAMFIVDGLSACLILIFLLFLILFIHYTSPPKQWGDVSQSLIYHQVRKYLLRLRQDNVKYWRPQVLLLIDNPRTSWNLIQFCNSLKKGGLYILGHVIITETFQDRYRELKRQKLKWTQFRDFASLKAFVQIGIGPNLAWGVRNVFLGSGLGGMKPNITVLGFFDLSTYAQQHPDALRTSSKSYERNNYEYNHQLPDHIQSLPTDSCKAEQRVNITEWVRIIEDLIILESNVAVAKGFPRLEIPEKNSPEKSSQEKTFIDLYPIQMSAQVTNKQTSKSALTTNFDTYTLILQLGAILNTVPQWKRSHKLRVVVFVEYQEDVEDEKHRLTLLLEALRIQAQIKILVLSDGKYKVYEYITKGTITDARIMESISEALSKDDWWSSVLEARKHRSMTRNLVALNKTVTIPFSRMTKRRLTMSNLQTMGVSMSMKTNNLPGPEISQLEYSDDDDYYSEDDMSLYSNAILPNASTVPDIPNGAGPKGFNESSRNMSSAAALHRMKGPGSESSTAIRNHSKPDGVMLKPKLSKYGSTSSIQSGTITPKKPIKSAAFTASRIPAAHVVEDAEGEEPSIMFVPETETNKPKQLAVRAPTTRLKPPSVNRSHDDSSGKDTTEVSEEDQESNSAQELEFDEDIHFSFNEITTKAQHLILNEIMKKISLNSSVIFSTLPTPEIGCHNSEADSLEYVQSLDVWCDGLPPILLINAQTMTVTTAL